VSTPGYHTPSKVVVIGGGYAGTVAANHLRMRADVDITLVNPRPEFVERIRLHQFVAEPGEATMNYGIWTAGFGVPELAAASGLLSDELGRLLTDETPTSVDDGRIIAAGDAAAPPGRPLRMSCQAAQPLRAQAADTVLSRITGTEPAVINQAFTGSCVPVTTGEHAKTVHGVDEHANEKSRLATLGPGRPLHCGIHRHPRLRTEVAHNARRIS
jgi:NADH dehydrogenase FAD-containing subunit